MAQHHCRAVEGSGQVEGEVCWNSKKIELIYMFLFKVIESVPEPFMETCFCSKKLLGRFAQSSWDLEKAPDAFVGVFCSNWLQWRTTSSGQRDNELRTGTSIGVTILF